MLRFAVITGASSGLGAEFARQLAAQGYALLLVARRADRLRALAAALPAPCEVFPADLAQRSECERLLQALQGRRIDLFINNAGFGDCGDFLRTDLEKDLVMLDVNVRAVHILTKRVAQNMQRQGGGALLNVGSAAGLLPGGPYMAAYYATKAYVVSLTTALAEELRAQRSPVQVACLCPGPVDTEFNKVAGVRFALGGLDAKRVARAAVDGLFAGRGTVVPGAAMKAMTVGRHFAPDWLLARITYHFQHKKGGA